MILLILGPCGGCAEGSPLLYPLVKPSLLLIEVLTKSGPIIAFHLLQTFQYLGHFSSGPNLGSQHLLLRSVLTISQAGALTL